MAIVNNESLVKFGYGVASKAVKEAGHITFASDTRQLFVGDGEKAVAFAGNVANAVFADKKLTITYNNGADAAVLDFSDVASAEGVSSLLGGLRKDVTANATAIVNLSTTVTNLDTSYKAADASLSERLDTLEGLVGEGGDVDERIADAIEALDTSLKTYADGLDTSIRADFAAEDASIRADFAAEDASIRAEFALADSSIRKDVSAYQTTNDAAVQANATAIGEVSTNLNTHATNGDIHVDASMKARWDNVADLAEVFFDVDPSKGDELKNTLKEIQEYITSDASAAATMTGNITKAQNTADQAVLDASAAQSTANQALALGQAAATKSEFDAYVSSNNAALAGVKATADAAAVKTTTDASLALKADASTVYTKSETYTKTEVDGLVAGANTNASTAESNAKNYADTQIAAIKVNGVTIKDASLDGTHIKVGGTDTHSSTTVSIAIEDLYSKVDAASKAGVQSLAVDTNSSNYAEVSGATGAVTLTIKKVALADASESNTGVADAYDVKTSIATAKSEAISAVQGEEGDASTAATVAGAKAYADAQIDAAALRWTVLS